MLRKSVETRDWVNTIEPRNVRAVMKRVVEDTTSIDVQVASVTVLLWHFTYSVMWWIWTIYSLNLLHKRLVFCMKKEWERHTAATPAKGLSQSTAAPGSKPAMPPATLQGTVAANTLRMSCCVMNNSTWIVSFFSFLPLKCFCKAGLSFVTEALLIRNPTVLFLLEISLSSLSFVYLQCSHGYQSIEQHTQAVLWEDWHL